MDGFGGGTLPPGNPADGGDFAGSLPYSGTHDGRADLGCPEDYAQANSVCSVNGRQGKGLWKKAEMALDAAVVDDAVFTFVSWTPPEERAAGGRELFLRIDAGLYRALPDAGIFAAGVSSGVGDIPEGILR